MIRLGETFRRHALETIASGSGAPLLVLCLLACALLPVRAAAVQSRIDGETIAGSLTVTVVRAELDTPTPIVGAFVLVGQEPGNPFKGNSGFTGTDGSITFADPNLNGAQTVTAGAEGYQYLTLVSVNADTITVALPPRLEFDLQHPPQEVVAAVSGKITGFSVDNGSAETGNGFLDAGLAFPLLNIEETLSLNPSSLLSRTVPFAIGGSTGIELELPDNVYLPWQIEYATWFRKSSYLWLAKDQAELQLGSLAGRIGTEDLRDWLAAGGSLSELVPLIELVRVGVSDPFTVNGPVTRDVYLCHELRADLAVQYENAPESYPVFFFAGGDVSGGQGSGRILPLGFNLAEDGYGYGNVQVSTADRSRRLAAMSYLYGAVAATLDAAGAPVLEAGLTAVVDRTGRISPPGTVVLDSFFQVVQSSFEPLGEGKGRLTFTEAYRGGATPSPVPSLSVSTVSLEVSLPIAAEDIGCRAGSRRSDDLPQWVVVAPGDVQGFSLPVLPPKAPPFLSRPQDVPASDAQYRLQWDLSVYGLTFGQPFDFNHYDFSTLGDRVTHLSRRRGELPLEGLSPSPPVNVVPVDSAHEVPTPLVLRATLFSDPDANDGHVASRWQVWPEGGSPEQPVLDQMDVSGVLTQLTILPGTLVPGQTYFWHVRYRDNRGMWSSYSAATSFTAGCLSSAICDDRQWCNGTEQCVSGECQLGQAPACNDGVSCTVDTCNEARDTCEHQAQSGLCDDGLWCNGAETCDAEAGCQAGTPRTCSDGISCTTDACNEETDACEHLAESSLCDDGLWCNGSETCDAVAGCRAGTPAGCDDGVSCTVDNCNEETDSCSHVPEASLCDDGLWCNGAEACDAVAGCQAGTPPICDDGISCTADGCNETTDSCDRLPQDGLCSDGLWCNGNEYCDAAVGCKRGTPPDCRDPHRCTWDFCSEQVDSCVHIALNALCKDGLWCNGQETCDLQLGCVAGTPPDCSDGVRCTTDTCNEAARSCTHTPDNSVCDDGRWCNGAETCEPQEDCQPGVPTFCDDGNPASTDVCDEDLDLCQSYPGVIPLPDPSGYGLIPGGDRSHAERVVYTFRGASGPVAIGYQLFDADSEEEIQISLNGRSLGYAPVTVDGQWGGSEALIMEDELVNDDALNVLIFVNSRNHPEGEQDGEPPPADPRGIGVGTPPQSETWGVKVTSDSLYLPNKGAYGRIPEERKGLEGAGQDPLGEVDFSFDGVGGDVLIEYEVYDVDDGREVQILVNGQEAGYARRTPDNSWGGRQNILLRDGIVHDTGLNLLAFRNTGYPQRQNWWGVRNVSVGFPLPEAAAYGLIPDGDQQHADRVAFSFRGTPGDLVLEYEGYDVDDNREVQILINGKAMGHAKKTPNAAWGGLQFLVLQERLVQDSSLNIVTFNSTVDPRKKCKWGVRRVAVKALGEDDLGNPTELSPLDSPFGLDYVFALSPNYHDPELARQLGGTVGVRWVNFVEIMWNAIEHNPPFGGVHQYDWALLDDAVMQWQQYGVRIMMSLRLQSSWGTAPKPPNEFVYLEGIFLYYGMKNADYLPNEENWQDLRDFVTNLVERYDGDGYHDMPGLKDPILHYQVGNEYHNEFFWAGNADEYGVLLKEVAASARSANPDVKLILSGLGFPLEVYPFYGDQMDPLSRAYVDANLRRVADNMQEFLVRGDRFTRRSMEFLDSYDIVDARWPDYGAVSKFREHLTTLGHPEKEIWSAEVYAWVPFLSPNVLPNWNLHALPSPSKEMYYLQELKKPDDPDYPVVNAWYRGMQAAMVVKNAMVALHAGSKKLMTGWAIDTQEDWEIPPLSNCGLMSATFRKLWPAGYTYKLLIEKLDGIKSIRRLPLPEGTFVYECLLAGGKRVLVAFYDDHIGQNHDEPHGVVNATIPFPLGSAAKVTRIITEIDVTEPEVELVQASDGKLQMQLTEHPVFIEAADE